MPNGHGSIEIMNWLNSKNILTPSKYKANKGRISKEWNQTTILAILKNQVYIGHTVQNKINKISYKSKKMIKVPKEKWIAVENTHKPIIDKELFDKVQLMIKGKDTAKLTKHDYLFKGLLKCHHCKRNLQIVLKSSGKKKVKNPYINCIGHQKRGGHPISMNYLKFEDSILENLNKICNVYMNDQMFSKIYKKYKSKTIDIIEAYQKQLRNMEDRITEINSNIDNIYFDKLKKIITKEDYMRYSNQFLEERKGIKEKIEEIKQKIYIMKNKEEETIDEIEIKNLVKEFLGLNEINKTIIYRFIQKIEIDTNKNVYIYFNFNSLNIISENIDEMIEFEKILKTG